LVETAWGDHLEFGLRQQGRHPTRTNKFNNYEELYIIDINGELYQFDFKSNQYMDKNDKRINPRELADMYPILWDIFEAISIKYNSLILVKNPSEEVCLSFVQYNGYVIQWIKNPSVTVCLAAVKQNSHAIYYIDNPSEEVCLSAVQQNCSSIGWIKNPSEAVCLAAVQQNVDAIQWINNPSEKVKKLTKNK
jgi:hypothetical protein